MNKTILIGTLFGIGTLFSQQDALKSDFIKTTEIEKIKVFENNK
ncbi:hypothetical protein [Tenacibaculum sp. M341]|nr:hypothetical protein [Tenacibaculum sp. M341]